MLTQISIRPAHSAAELRSAAYLRAASFYTYPEGRSEYAKRAHFRMKADAAFTELEDKLAGRDEAYRDTRVAALVAVAPCSSADAVAALLPDASCLLPAHAAGAAPEAVIGTLDINWATRLPSEELSGSLPAAAAGHGLQRAYLSNVCVAQAARRQGVARALIEHAADLAASKGTVALYVHVADGNDAAARLYLDCGFAVEAEEQEAVARLLNRPRRRLLLRALQPPVEQ